MKKFLISMLIIPLSGCFMYNNLKQSVNCIFDDSACDVEYVTDFDDEKIQKDAENLISDRCLKELKYKNGTIEYMHCS